MCVVFTDTRYVADTMDKWDEEKLRSVIMSKHGNPRTTTDVSYPSALDPPGFSTSSILDRMQVLYRSCRDTKVRRFCSMVFVLKSDTIPSFQVRMVLAMSQWRIVSIPTRASARIRAQVSEEGAGGGREGKHDQPGGILRSGGASVSPA
jgi:hypothetical protein